MRGVPLTSPPQGTKVPSDYGNHVATTDSREETMKNIIPAIALLALLFSATMAHAKKDYTLCADIVSINVEATLDSKGNLRRTMKILLKELETFDNGDVAYKKRFPDKVHSYELNSRHFSGKDRDVYIRFLEAHLMGEDLDTDIDWCYLVDEQKKAVVKVTPLR